MVNLKKDYHRTEKYIEMMMWWNSHGVDVTSDL